MYKQEISDLAARRAAHLTNKRVRTRLRRCTATLAFLCVAFFTLVSISQLSRSDRFHKQKQLGNQFYTGHRSKTVVAKTRSDFALQPRAHSLRAPQTHKRHWRITTGYRRPDGVLKSVYLINDEFPGPTIETRPGDRLVIEVENGLQGSEDVTLQWHGLSMRTEDIESLQETIMPGKSITFNFTNDASQHGTFWYSARNLTQHMNGLYGGFIIHPPGEIQDPECLGTEHLLLISECSHRASKDALETSSPSATLGIHEAIPDSVILNGAGTFPCDATVFPRLIGCTNLPIVQLSALKLTTDRRSVLRVINVGVNADIELAIHGSEFTVLSVDGVAPAASEPSRSIGQIRPQERVDVLVRLSPVVAHYRTHLEISLKNTNTINGNSVPVRAQRFPIDWVGV